MTWYYDGEVLDESLLEGKAGFVYLITNKTNGKKYIGKKLLTEAKTYQLNKKKKRKRVESKWREYVGSNDLLIEDFKSGDLIHKEILHLCTSKGWMSYYETKEILMNDAIISDSYYNSWVSCKIRKSHLKGTS